MKRNRFVKPGDVRLPLFGASIDDPECEWIDVKERITYGDQQKLAAVIFNSMVLPSEVLEDENQLAQFKEGLRLKLDLEMDGPYKILIWGLDWNLEDGDGNIVEFCYDSIINLDPVTAAEINRVIDAHAARVEEAAGKPSVRQRGPKLKS
jgi:hypothetical protein